MFKISFDEINITFAENLRLIDIKINDADTSNDFDTAVKLRITREMLKSQNEKVNLTRKNN
jgi:hypothetical protein